MAFANYIYPQVIEQLNLVKATQLLFSQVDPLALIDHARKRIEVGRELAVTINTEKARSEFLIAQILLELRLVLPEKVGLYSGNEIVGDAESGLFGVCDFILTRGPQYSSVRAPLVAIMEAKNSNVREGYGQCIAAMVAAREMNAKAKTPTIQTIYGCASTGTNWLFFRLSGQQLTIDRHEYHIDNAAEILGILAWIVLHG
jgi:hypothetical protein